MVGALDEATASTWRKPTLLPFRFNLVNSS